MLTHLVLSCNYDTQDASLRFLKMSQCSQQGRRSNSTSISPRSHTSIWIAPKCTGRACAVWLTLPD